MKQLKKFASVLLAMLMAFAMTVTAFAAGETGSITIEDSDTVSVAGKTFNAYKILDVKLVGESYVYTVPAELKNFYTGRYNLTGNEGDFDAQVAKKISEETDMFAFAADALAAAKAANITPGTATAVEGDTSVTINNLPLGYYVVEDVGAATPISALILDTTNPNVTVEIKAEKPSIDKKIEGNKDIDDSTTGDVKYNNAAVGDKVPYKLTSHVPDMTGYEKYYFVVNDTLSKGLTFNNDVAITIGDKTLVKDTDYTVTSTENDEETTSVEIVFKNFIQYKDQAGATITITYSATVNEDAVIGTAGNKNEVTVTYSNNPNIKDNGTPGNPDKPTPDSPTGETPKSETRTYVTGIELIKVDPDGNRLTGAEFKISGEKTNIVLVTKEVYTAADGTEPEGTEYYYLLEDGTYTKVAPNGDEEYDAQYADIETKYIKETVTESKKTTENVEITGAVGDDGVLRFDGLSAGVYTITEIKAPDGYNLLEEPITVTIGFTAPKESSTECTWTYTGTDKVNDVGINQITVTNETGSELPSTGGRGTTVFYVLGSILAIGAAILLVTKRRMNVER